MIVATTQVLYDGIRNCVIQLNGRDDGSGASDNETNVIKVKASDLLPPGDRHLRIRCVNYDVKGGGVTLSWGGDDPIPFLFLGDEGNGTFDYRKTGGAPNPGSKDKTTTGDIMLSTSGFAEGSTYSIKLEMVKA